MEEMIEGIEWLFIGIIILLLIFYDPKKIVQLSKALAQAKKEYEKASSMLMEQIEKESRGIEEIESQQSKPNYEQESPDAQIIRLARELNIETYGKTLDEIKAEINRKVAEQLPEDRQAQLQPITLTQQTANNDSMNKDSSNKTPSNNLEDKKSERPP